MTRIEPVSAEYVMEQVAKGRKYVFGILVEGPTPITDEALRSKKQMEHLQFLFGLKKAGKLVLVGPVTDEWHIHGICIFNSTDKEEVKALMNNDPYVVVGHYKFEAYDWFGLPGDGLPE